MEKYYKINESELIDLLASRVELEALNAGGVDNWEWYGESRRDILKERFPDATEGDLEDMDFYDCARADLENYVLVKES